MPKLNPETQRARREHILDAAELCFARAGFHRTTMQDICKEAEVSPGALYTYFDSKEALISGLIERDRAKLASQFADMAGAPDFLAALQQLAEHYALEEPQHKRALCIEIGAESTRNARVRQTFLTVDQFVIESFEKLLTRLEAEGRIMPTLDIPTIARIFTVIGDGVFWRRAVDPAFDPKLMLPVLISLIAPLVNPTGPVTAAGGAQPPSRPGRASPPSKQPREVRR